MSSEPCPCQSGKSFESCCHPFLNGDASPETAEALMRSRYTAYVKKNISYIQETMTGPSLVRFNALETAEWLEHVIWNDLHILSKEKGNASDTTGIVEFQAIYTENGVSQMITECSEFKKINGIWFYTHGKHY